MINRPEVETLLRSLYEARMNGQLHALCELFGTEARFSVSGNSAGKPIAINADGAQEIQSWLTIMLKTFRLTDFESVSTVIDASQAAVHWRANIHSRVTGIAVPTDLVDLVRIDAGRIASFTEFFVAR